MFDWSYSARGATTIYPYINCTLSLRPTSYGPEVTGSNSLLFFGLAENYPSGYCIIIISKKTNRINWGFQNLPVSHVFEEKDISLLIVPYKAFPPLTLILHTSLYLISWYCRSKHGNKIYWKYVIIRYFLLLKMAFFSWHY